MPDSSSYAEAFKLIDTYAFKSEKVESTDNPLKIRLEVPGGRFLIQRDNKIQLSTSAENEVIFSVLDADRAMRDEATPIMRPVRTQDFHETIY